MIRLVVDARVRSTSAVRTLPVPLAAPSPAAALAFVELLAGQVLSSGSGRRQRAASTPRERRSDQGYLTFYRAEQSDADHSPEITALKSRATILRYLQGQVALPIAEHWVGLQTTQFRARRDGQAVAGYTADQTRHLLAIVADLDGQRMEPRYRDLLARDWWAFQDALEAQLDALGIDMYLAVRSSETGVHLYVPLVRPDGRPLRAGERTLADWERAARGLCRYLVAFGADANAVKPTQPFAIPGIPRGKHRGYIPYVITQRPGARTNLYSLIWQLSAHKVLYRREKAPQEHAAVDRPSEVDQLLTEIATAAAGLAMGEGRNNAAHDIAAMLLAKGAGAEEAWAALTEWNERNSPPLPEWELRRCFESAERGSDRYPAKWEAMRAAAWNRLRAQLELPAAQASGYLQNGRWRPLTPRKSWEVRRATPGGREHYEEVGERLIRLVRGAGGTLELTQAEMCDRIDTNRSTLKAVLAMLLGEDKLCAQTRRGRGGGTVLTLPVSLTENGQSGISSEAAKKGEWVGPAVPALPGHPSGAAPSVFDTLIGLVRDLLGVAMDPLRAPVPLVPVLDAAAGGWRVVPRALRAREMAAAFEAAGGVSELNRRMGTVQQLPGGGCSVPPRDPPDVEAAVMPPPGPVGEEDDHAPR